MLKGIGKTRSGLKAKAKQGRKDAMDDDNLANNYGDKDKVTRGDIISQAIHNKKGKKK
jgi:hypothetical protein